MNIPDRYQNVLLHNTESELNYSFVFFFEKKFYDADYRNSKKVWMSENWHKSFIYAFVYIVCIFIGQYLMKSREKYDLRKLLIAWNFILAAFSAIGTVRVWPEFYNALFNHGVEYSVCNDSFTHGVSGCWAWLFILSKVPELFDTVFIVLRKQQLIFLHWYHHATVLIYCWFACKDFSASGRWFVVMNYTVHAFMYAYYAFRALRFQIPKFVNIAITTGQMSQMVFGIYVNYKAYQVKKRGDPCEVSDENIQVSLLMYATYFFLFFNFFYFTYIKKSPKSMIISKKNGANGANGVHHNHIHDKNNNLLKAKNHVE